MRSRAWSCHRQGDGAEAERLYRELLRTDRDAADAVNLGALLRGQGRLREAIEHYQHWLPHFPDITTLRLNAVNCAIEANALPMAQAWLQQTPASQGQNPDLKQAEARVLLASGDHQRSVELLKGLSRQRPGEASIWLDLGACHHRRGERREALAAFEEAGRLDPGDPRAAANRLTLLKELGEWDAAQQLIGNLPGSVRSHTSFCGAYAQMLMERQQLLEAADEFSKLCAADPAQPSHWLNRAACLRGLKHTMAATAVVKQGLRWQPQHTDLRYALGQNLAELGKQRQAMALLWDPPDPEREISQQHLFNLQFLGAGYGLIQAADRARMARNWEMRQQAQGVGALWADHIREPLNQGRPLRVGYISADLCNHPVGRFLLPLLQAHDPKQVEVVGLSCGPHRDEVTQQLQQACSHWVDLRFASDLEAARMVSDLKVDVLVELGGFTAGSRLGVLCHRPAPMQLSYLGYFAPTYLGCIDGWIGDAELFGDLEQADQQQTLLLAKGGYMAFQETELPVVEHSCHNRFRFGSFNHARKLTPEAVDLFCSVMAAVPEAELLLKSVSFIEQAEQARVRTLFEQAGLPSHRLILLPWVEGRSNHLRCYCHIDVALDPIPYGGATTTCEALVMGVPVVALAGAGMVGRLSASILSASGCSSWIASTVREYVAIAQGLAQQGLRNAPARQALREQITESNLCNSQRLARDMERLYREAAARSLNAASR